MPGYHTRKIDVQVGAFHCRIRALSDHMQFADPEGEAANAGICSASWSLFGQLWPASRVLAQAVKHIDIHNRRIIELGCGLGLPSLLLQSRGADITASDHHPLSEPFLDYNSALNKLPPIPYLDLPWADTALNVGKFDLIVGSDILYEGNHAELVGDVIGRIAADDAKVLITCPGRGYRNRLTRRLEELGFEVTETRMAFSEDQVAPFKGRLLCYRRGNLKQAA
ncbi:class I SAM-dependent methyltransferase [Isoalcanivorax beigongshangi]|uniref:Methyltransferase n=1 Tax=Isoalcanivorax beigongshangi TaxID=3238810 RepID=A0ABV4AD41_9GAMM